MTPKHQLSKAELESRLEEQLRMLERSANAFDEGHLEEAANMAVRIRILCHDGRGSNSRSLLGQLGLLTDFVNTASDLTEDSLAPFGGLVAVRGSSASPGYVALLDTAIRSEKIPFQKWWTAPIFRDIQRRTISRETLVRTVADQDGGAHVDGSLEPTYSDLSRNNSLRWFTMRGMTTEPLVGAERFAIRQIAHEVLKTLKTDYHNSPKTGDGLLILSDVRFETRSISSGFATLPGKKIGRNASCPCGSGLKFKRCHGQFV